MRFRVSQNWAGAGWGGIVIPRIGMEVVVEFLEGDPDKPLVTGCVYNGRNKVPYELPKHKTVSTFKSDTHQGEGYNEIASQDQQGQEEIYLHAQKDMNIKICNHRSERIDANRVNSIGGAELSEVSRSSTKYVGDNYTISVGVGREGATVRGELLSNPGGILQSAYFMDDLADFSGVGGNYTLRAGGSINVSADRAMSTTIGGAASLSVGAALVQTVAGSVFESAHGNATEVVNGTKLIDVHGTLRLRCGLSEWSCVPMGQSR